MSCAVCHIPSGAFVDHRQHDVGSGGLYKTPTLLSADFNAPYFHDGRFDNFDQVVAHFDKVFDLGLSPQDRSDLVAYLTAIGDGIKPYERDGVTAQLKEVNDFASVLDIAIAERNMEVINLAVDTVGRELRELTEQFPDRRDPAVVGGEEQRLTARAVLKTLVLKLRRIESEAASGQFAEAAAEYANYHKLTFVAVPILLRNAQPWSLFNPVVHDAHYGALRRLLTSKSTN
jgi:Di-haem cytochrome c peroxidase